MGYQWVCLAYGFFCNETEGIPEEGIVPNTNWGDVSDDWMFPECEVGKQDFAL